MSATDTQLQQLVINVGTTAQIEAAIQDGTITSDMLSVTTDALEYSTAIDADIVGSLTVSANGDVSGLSNSNYLIFPGIIDMTNASTFEIVFAFTTSASVTSGSIINCISNMQHPLVIALSYSHIYVQVNNNTHDITMIGTTTLQTNTKYYAKLTYDGTNYTLYLSTDGVTWNNEGSMAATNLIGNIAKPYQLGRKSAGNAGLSSMHLAECYIKKDNMLIWSGLGEPGLHQRAIIGHEVIEFQEPRSSNNYTWYRKYRDGWVEQGGFIPANAGTTAVVTTLPVEMADGNYTVLGSVMESYTGTSSGGLNFYDRTTTSFKTNKNNNTRNLMWQVSGIAA